MTNHESQVEGYPLVICYITDGKIVMLLMGKSTISMVIFNNYFDITRGICTATI